MGNSDEVAEEVTGTVKSYNTNQGYGFIADVPGLTQDVFFRKEDLPGQLFMKSDLKGCLLKFSLIHNSGNGKYSAANLQDPKSHPTFRGTVKSWSVGKGYGFITCPRDLENLAGPNKKDIFMGNRSMIDESFASRPDLQGAPVMFSVERNAQGLSATFVRFPNLDSGNNSNNGGNNNNNNGSNNNSLNGSPNGPSGNNHNNNNNNSSMNLNTMNTLLANSMMGQNLNHALATVGGGGAGPGSLFMNAQAHLNNINMMSKALQQAQSQVMGGSMGGKRNYSDHMSNHSHNNNNNNMLGGSGNMAQKRSMDNNRMGNNQKRRKAIYPEGRQKGHVVSFVKGKYGFISCPRLENEVFFLAPQPNDNLLNENSINYTTVDPDFDFIKGTVCEFYINVDEKTQKPRARDLEICHDAPNALEEPEEYEIWMMNNGGVGEGSNNGGGGGSGNNQNGNKSSKHGNNKSGNKGGNNKNDQNSSNKTINPSSIIEKLNDDLKHNGKISDSTDIDEENGHVEGLRSPSGSVSIALSAAKEAIRDCTLQELQELNMFLAQTMSNKLLQKA